MNRFYIDTHFQRFFACMLLTTLFFYPHLSKSQSQKSKIEVRVIRLYTAITGGDGAGNSEYEHRWVFKYTTGKFNSSNVDEDWSFTNRSCFERDSENNGWFNFNSSIYLGDDYDKLPDNIQLIMEYYERDGNGDACYYNPDQDDNYGLALSPIFDIQSLAPGVWSDKITFLSAGNTQGAEIQIRYTLPTPTNPLVNGVPMAQAGILCADLPVTLTSLINLTNTTGLTYEWQYQISGDTETNPDYAACTEYCPKCPYIMYSSEWYFCTLEAKDCIDNCAYLPEKRPAWRTLGTSTAPTLDFSPRSKIFPQAFTATTGVAFRVKVMSSEIASTYGSSGYYQFAPPPPEASQITVEASCDTASGIVHVTDVKSQFSSYRYILKKGNVEQLGCNPDNDGSCLTGDLTGSDEDSNLDIPNVPAGTYTLFLLNNAGTEGFCPRRISVVTVPLIPRLSATLDSPQNPACNGLKEGSIRVSTSGGRSGTVSYDWENLTTGLSSTRTSQTANAVVQLDQLSPGAYKLTVSDGCTPAVPLTYEITQPVQIGQLEFQAAAATCFEPGNGTARIKVSRSTGAFDRSVSATLRYRLFKGGMLYRDTESTETTYTWTDLPVEASYQAIVTEKGGTDCNGVTVNFSITGPTPLGITSPTVRHASCFQGNDGAITVTGTGGTGSYVYTLSGAATMSNSTGSFQGLGAGNYTVSVRNTLPCNDSYVHPTLTLTQPTPVVASLSKQDISCHGQTDGQITAVVSGGTPGTGYRYTWETKLASDWTALSLNTSQLTGLGAGQYRLRVTDAGNCVGWSNEVSMIEPTRLSISGVQVNDIRCLGETGQLVVSPWGGTSPYTFAYSLNNGASFTEFTADTPLTEGTYRIRVTDARGCSYQTPDLYSITAPPSSLRFTETLSDYNGYQISCLGGSNGWATLAASGGNGGAYTGYTYALDNGPFQPGATLEGIAAGTHTLRLKDARGCVVSKTVSFTQTSEALSTTLVEKKDVVCLGDATGIWEVKAVGGLAPYQYRLNQGPFQNQGRFTQLPAGDYTITVKDRNGCDHTVSNTIISTTPPMQIATVVNDVSCFGGRDGSIAATVSGGLPPFRYQWTGLSGTSSTRSELASGAYTVIVTDQAGCTAQASANVLQPAQSLQVRLATVPVCYGSTQGSITVAASGGSIPYQYSIDQGLTYQADPLFRRGVGTYDITTRDSKGCLTTATAQVVLRNDQPQPNFLVATQRQALDTLVVTEISVPKPDSVTWVFDPRFTVISPDANSPQLRVPDAGTYSVQMTGYFGGCAYSLTKQVTIHPYDPNALKEKLPGYQPIESVQVSPNPSTGTFEVEVKLNKKYSLSLVVYDVMGVAHYQNTWKDIGELRQTLVLDKAAAGIYLLRVITETDAREIRLVVSK